MAFSVNIIADSVSQAGKRLTTLTATYPRFVHAEVMTHRDRERNAASSRAIPWRKMKDMILTEPVIPIRWGAEQKGMQAGDEIPQRMQELAEYLWLQARDWSVYYADLIHNIGKTYADRYPAHAQPGDEDIRIHKSLPNRLTEPWMWITVVMTATEWENFYRLRCHPDAEIHFQKIANMIRDARAASTPVVLKDGEWHLPFIQDDEKADSNLDIEVLKQASVARSARVSYLTHEGVRSIAKDLDTFERLANGSGFGHWSPHGHVACAMEDEDFRSGPFVGWRQFRKDFINENVPG
jgi:thymidylate synthase ThyX